MLKNIIVLPMPIEQMEKAVKITAKSKVDQGAIDDERRNKYQDQTEEQVRRLAGEEGVQRFAADVADFNARKKAIAEKAAEEIKALWKNAVAFIDEETLPKGEDVQNEPDFALLDHDIVDGDQLERLIEKHSDNRAFRLAAARYAVRQGWPEADQFTAIDKEKAIREYTDQIFSRLIDAAAYPTGPSFLQYVDSADTEYLRIARAYGIEAEFLASGGSNMK